MDRVVSRTDEVNLQKVRDNVSAFMGRCGTEHNREETLLLDVAPQDHEGAAPYFPDVTIETLDIDPESGATYIADLTEDNSDRIPSERFDFVVCTEVLEHTVQPFDAVRELHRVLKPGGLAFVTTPFNLRIHGPLPDCWRFTEHGLRALFKDWDILELSELDDPDRFLMPTHYTLIAARTSSLIRRT